MRKPTSREIRNIVCEYLRVSRPEIESDRRTKELVICRSLIVYLCCKLTSESCASIGATIWRSPYAVYDAKKAAHRLLAADPGAQELVALLIGRIREERTKKLTAGLAAKNEGAGDETSLHETMVG